MLLQSLAVNPLHSVSKAALICAVLCTTIGTAAQAQSQYVYDANDPRVGMNIWQTQSLGNQTSELNAWKTQIDQMYNAGFRDVNIIPRRYVDADGVISLTNGNGRVSISDANLAAVIDYARAKPVAMNVTLKPHVTSTNNSLPRSALSFAPGSAFWTNYRNTFQAFADIAQGTGSTPRAQSLIIGSELTSLLSDSANATNWTNVISDVNTRFQGQIGAHTEHWTVANPTIRNNVWNNSNIDFIGTSGYISYNLLNGTEFPDRTSDPYNNGTPTGNFPLATTAQSQGSNSSSLAFAQIVADRFGAWVDDRLTPTSAQVSNKPIRVLEYGVTPFDRATETPWQFNFAAANPGWWNTQQAQEWLRAYDPDEQLRALQGMLIALDGRNTGTLGRVSGVDLWVWAWDTDNNAANGGFWGETFGLNPNVDTDISWTGFDESLSRNNAQFVSNWIQGSTAIPEPTAIAAILGMAGSMLLRRERKV
jgi:hypothetical protein